MVSPLISVIVPVYNLESKIDKCIKSILEQSLKNIEIIIVNDGSTDKSLEIIKKYINQDSRIILIDKKNGGLTSARNAGLKIAKAEYIQHIDGDDWVEENFLEDTYKFATENDLDVVITDIFFEQLNGKIDYYEDMKIKNFEIFKSERFYKYHFEETGINKINAIWNKLFKRKLYTDNKIEFNERIFLGEDLEALLRLVYFSKKIGKINKAYVHYMQYSNNGSKEKSAKSFFDMSIAYENLEFFFENEKTMQKKIRIEASEQLLIKLISLSDVLEPAYSEKAIKRILEISFKNGIIFNIKNYKFKICIFILRIYPSINVVKIAKKFQN